MTRLLCITPNPALDRTLTVPGFAPGAVFRTSESLLAAGGKGLNVARAAHNLRAESISAAPLGGFTGKLIASLAEREGLRGAWTWVGTETRTCTIIVDENTATVVNEAGMPLEAGVWQQFTADVLAQTETCDSLCLAGSFPPGVSAQDASHLIAALVATGKPMWVDSSGMALHAALESNGANIKVNDDEIGAVLGMGVTDIESGLEAASQAHRQTGGAVVVTLGALGAVMVSREGRFLAQPPAVSVVSAVGSGDSFLAGLATTGASLEGLRRAAAAGTTNTLTVGGGQFTHETFEQILAQTQAWDR